VKCNIFYVPDSRGKQGLSAKAEKRYFTSFVPLNLGISESSLKTSSVQSSHCWHF
jgi:hypothetical protein